MSFKNYKRSIILDFNYDEVKKGVPQANKQMALLNAEFRKQSEVAKQSGSTIEKLGVQHEAFANRVRVQANKVSILKKELEELTSSENRNEKAITNKTIELKNAETQLMKYQTSVEKANKELEAQENVIVRAGTAVGDFAEKSKEAGVDLDKLAGNMQKVGAVMMGIGIAALKMRGDVDQEMAKVKTIADTTTISFEDLRKGVMQTSNDFNLPATQMAEGLYNVISSNVETSESLHVLRDSAILAKTGFTDMANATDILTTIVNSYGYETERTTKLVDQLITTQKLGKATVDELGSSFGKVAGLAATAEVPVEELLAAIATLTTRGIEAGEAVTGLRGIFTALIKPTAEAREEAQRLGLQFNLAALQSKGLAGFLEDVQVKTRGNDDSMAKLFGRVEGLNSMFILTGNGAEMFARNVEEITNASGTANQALEDINTPMERFNSALNQIKNSLTETGGSLAPLLNMVSAFLELIAKIPPGVMTTIAIMGTAIFTVGTAVKSFLKMSDAAQGLGKIIGFTVNPTLIKTIGIIMAVTAALAILLALIVAIKGNAGEVERVARSTSQIGSNFNTQVNQSQRQVNRTVQGYHRRGLDRVPYDNYQALLHENEEVLTADDPRNRNSKRNKNDFNGLNNTPDQDERYERLLERFDKLITATEKMQQSYEDNRRFNRMGEVVG